MLLRLDNVSLAFGSRPLLDHVALQVGERERVCIVGRNGEGKSSLLRLVHGTSSPDEGGVWLKPAARIAWLAQDIVDVGTGTVRTVVESGLAAAGNEEAWQRERRVEELIERLALDGNAQFTELSGGWRRRALLARALAAEPHVLLLDEPTNHLDIPAIEWLEQLLLEFRGALLFVSHDRRFIDRIATRIVELDRGQLTSWPGDYDAYARGKAQQLANEAQANALFDKKLAQEEVWIRKGVEARRTRNEGRVRALHQLRAERRQRRERTGRVDLALQMADASGKKVFEADHAAVRIGARTIFHDFTATIMRGDRVGVVGPNGAGKSTLLRLLLGELEPSAGTMQRGTRLQVAYYDQQRAQLQLDQSVMTNVSDRNDHVVINGEARHVSGYLRDFLFRPEQLNTPASALSGGERNRLLLARLFASPANLLVMDEPTNDLDIDTLELLEELVAGYPGTLLLVSHDRAFLDHVVTSLLIIEDDGSVREFIGGYSDWLRYRASRATASAAPARAVQPTPVATTSSRRPAKLSYKDQREFDAMPGRIEALEAEHARLTAVVNEPQFYAQERAVVAATLASLQDAQQQVDSAYARWAELETLRAGPA